MSSLSTQYIIYLYNIIINIYKYNGVPTRYVGMGVGTYVICKSKNESLDVNLLSVDKQVWIATKINTYNHCTLYGLFFIDRERHI